MRRYPILAPALITLVASAGPGATLALAGDPEPVLDPRAEARQWFDDARFGLAVHWGVDSLLAKGEAVMETDKLPITEYEKLPPRFNPNAFDAESWVKTAQAAGARFLSVTGKHHSRISRAL